MFLFGFLKILINAQNLLLQATKYDVIKSKDSFGLMKTDGSWVNSKYKFRIRIKNCNPSLVNVALLFSKKMPFYICFSESRYWQVTAFAIKLMIKTPSWCHFFVSLLIALNTWYTLIQCFCCKAWTYVYLIQILIM